MSSSFLYDKSLSLDWNGKLFILTVRGETSPIANYLYSYDGINWSQSEDIGNTSVLTNKNPYTIKWTGTNYTLVGNLTTTSGNVIMRSLDGLKYSVLSTVNQTIPIYDIETNLEHQHTITYPQNTLLAVGGKNGDTVKIAYSLDDGLSWSPSYNSNSIFSTSANNACWNGKYWVAVGKGGNTIATSTDGNTWIGRGDFMFSTAGYGVAWSREQTMWVTTGEGINSLAYSIDGVFWRGLGNSIFSKGYDIVWNGNIWVAAGVPATTGNKALIYSTNGKTWLEPAQTDLFDICANKVIWTGTTWIATGQSSVLRGYVNIATSQDGIKWTPVRNTLLSGNNIVNIFSSSNPNGNAVLLTGNTLSVTAQDPDLLATDITSSTQQGYNSVLASGNTYVVGGAGANPVSFSTNYGATYTASNNGSSIMTTYVGVASNISQYMAVGTGTNKIAYSANGNVWAATSGQPFSTSGNAVVWADTLSMWIAVGSGTNSIVSSTNGNIWTTRGAGILYLGNDVKWNGTIIVATGINANNTGGAIAYSTNGTSWSLATGTVFDSEGYKLAWNGTYWIASGNDSNGNTLIYSSDGITWSNASSTNIFGNTFTGMDVANGNIYVGYNYGPGNTYGLPVRRKVDLARNWYSITCDVSCTKLVACTYAGNIYRSTNGGGNWTDLSSAGIAYWYDVASNADGTRLYGARYANGNIFISRDSGSTWIDCSSAGARNWRRIACSADGTKAVATIYNNASIWNTTNSGNTWTQRTPTGSTWLYDVCVNSDGTKMACVDTGTNGNIFTSTDSGNTWTKQVSPQTTWGAICCSSDGTILIASPTYVTTTANVSTSSDSGVTWTRRIFATNNVFINGLACSANGTTVIAAGSSGTAPLYYGYIYVSYDSGATWVAQTNLNRSFTNVACSADAQLMAFSSTSAIAGGPPDYLYTNQFGNIRIATATSPTSSTWTITDVSLSYPQAFIYDTSRNTYTAGDYVGNIVTSTNGTTWTTPSTKINSLTRINEFAYQPAYSQTTNPSIATNNFVGNGNIIIAGGSGANPISFSTNNGATFTASNNGASMMTTTYGLGFNNTSFIAVGIGTYPIAYSTNGSVWTAAANQVFSTRGNAVIWANTLALWVAVGAGTNAIATSTDGNSWTGYGTTALSYGNDIKWDGAMLVATGKNAAGTEGAIVYSTNGTSWSVATGSNFNREGTKVAWNGSYWIAVGLDTSGNTMMYSSSGTSWAVASATNIIGNTFTMLDTVPGGNIYAGYIGEKYKGVINRFTSLTGSGSRAWNTIISTKDGSKMVAGLSPGNIWTSYDYGVTWTERTFSSARYWFTIAGSTDLTKLVAVDMSNNTGGGGYIYTSTDSGATWTARTGPGLRSWYNAASNSDGTKLVASVRLGNIWTSTDSGVTWTDRSGAGTRTWDLNNLACSSNGNIIYSSDSTPGYIYVSTDSGATWTAKTASGSRSWRGLCCSSDGTIAYAGVYGGRIYKTTDTGNTWSQSTWDGNRNWWVLSTDSSGEVVYAGIGNAGTVAWSNDGGITWTLPSIVTNKSWRGLSVYTNGATMYSAPTGDYIYVISAKYNTISVGTSPLSSSWTNVDVSLNNPSSLVYDPARVLYTAADLSGNTVTSANGVYWTTPTNKINAMTAVYKLLLQSSFNILNTSTAGIYNGTYYVAGGSGSVTTSVDGTSWNSNVATISNMSTIANFAWNRPYQSATTIQPLTIACGEGNTTLAYSTDGIYWNSLNKNIFSTRANKAIWNGTMWIAVGAGTYTIATSYDGIKWVGREPSVIFSEALDVAWNGTAIVVVGVSSTQKCIATSFDGVYWNTPSSATGIFTTQASAIAWTGTYWLAYGSGGNTTANSTDLSANTWTNAFGGYRNVTVTDMSSGIVDIGYTATDASASTYTASYPPINAFDNSLNPTNSTEWRSASSVYHAVTGLYTGSVTTSFTYSGFPYTLSGEWIQIKLTSPVILKYYYMGFGLSSDATVNTAIPKRWTLVGSSDGINWVWLHAVNISSIYPPVNRTYDNIHIELFNIYTNTNNFSYYRMIIMEKYPYGSTTYARISEFDLLYENATTKTLSRYIKPVILPSYVLMQTPIIPFSPSMQKRNVYWVSLSLSAAFYNITQGVNNIYGSNFPTKTFNGAGNAIITSTTYDGEYYIATALNGNLCVMSAKSFNTNFNFDTSLNGVVYNTGITGNLYGSCFNGKRIILCGEGGNTITYSQPLSKSTTASFYPALNANQLFSKVYSVASNSGYGLVYSENRIYFDPGEKMTVVTPKYYNKNNVNRNEINFTTYSGYYYGLV